jgi:hypothetical protein
MGHNKPPVELEQQDLLVPFAAYIEEAEHWLDGVPVINEEQLEAVDTLLLHVKAAEKLVARARDAATKPLHDAWKAEVARWKAPLDDLERQRRGLAHIASEFKVRLADEREVEARRLRLDAERSMRSAQELAKRADPGDIHSVRIAKNARSEAEEALRASRQIEKARPKGIRTVRKWAFLDGDGRRRALHWIAQNDRDAVTEFIETYVARNFRQKPIEGVNVWEEREAY